MKNSRKASFIAIAIIYVLAAALGVLVYRVLPMDGVWLKLLIADVAATVFTFIFSLIFSNASVYDPYWSVQPIVIALGFFINAKLTAASVLALIAVLYWGIRLTANWAYTFKGLNHQDWRYTMLNEKTGAFYPLINFLGIHMFPTLVVYACTLPVIEVIMNAYTLNALSVVFFALSLFAATLQLVADIQMQSFRNAKIGGFIRKGLWKYSRHPNYLGEILMWWGMGLFAVSLVPDKWYLIAGAIVNTVMFLFVSIPMAEKRQSKKDGYATYKKETRMLLPIKI